jgi:hypothetical protein
VGADKAGWSTHSGLLEQEVEEPEELGPAPEQRPIYVEVFGPGPAAVSLLCQ